MKKFYKTFKFKIIDKIIIVFVFIFIFDILIFNIFSESMSINIVKISKIKIKEISNYYLNQTIKKYLNSDVNNYIKLNMVNNNIYSVNIDNKNANELLIKFIDDLQNNSKMMESGNIKYYNMEMLKNNNGLVMFIPSGIGVNNALFSFLGPKIPIKLNFLENITAYVDVVVNNYGINNSLIKLYIIINIEEVIEMPISTDKEKISYKFLLSSKLINGKVPSIIGTNLTGESNIVKSDVN